MGPSAFFPIDLYLFTTLYRHLLLLISSDKQQ